MQVIAKNKKAYYDYEIIKEFTAGLVLEGSEIKSIRNGEINLSDAFIKVNSNLEAFIFNFHIRKFTQASLYAPEPDREKKLLLNRKELIFLSDETKQKSMSIVPTMLIISDSGYAKIVIALARGKKNYDKRHSLKEKSIKRDIARSLKNY